MRLPKQTSPVLRRANPKRITSAVAPSQLGDLLSLGCQLCNVFPPGRDRNDCLRTCTSITKPVGDIAGLILPFL
jgi:hypothetical protein